MSVWVIVLFFSIYFRGFFLGQFRYQIQWRRRSQRFKQQRIHRQRILCTSGFMAGQSPKTRYPWHSVYGYWTVLYVLFNGYENAILLVAFSPRRLRFSRQSRDGLFLVCLPDKLGNQICSSKTRRLGNSQKSRPFLLRLDFGRLCGRFNVGDNRLCHRWHKNLSDIQ